MKRKFTNDEDEANDATNPLLDKLCLPKGRVELTRVPQVGHDMLTNGSVKPMSRIRGLCVHI